MHAPSFGMAYSLILINRVVRTRPLLSAAAYPCFNSSDNVTAPARRDPPVAADSIIALLRERLGFPWEDLEPNWGF